MMRNKNKVGSRKYADKKETYIRKRKIILKSLTHFTFLPKTYGKVFTTSDIP